MGFHMDVMKPNPILRRRVLRVLEAALNAVNPYNAVLQAMRWDGNALVVMDKRYDLGAFHRIFVIGAGKAAVPMAQAVETTLGDRIDSGLVVTKTDHGGPTERVRVAEASHPVPDEAGVAAGKEILTLARQATADDLVIALISGGGSALLVAPAEGITLSDIQAMTDALLACGATINEINTLRKHVSGVKGGQLARAVAPATLVTLVLSDVIGNPLDIIASGPTAPDTGTWRDAWVVVEKYGLEDRLPPAIVQRLQAGIRGEIPDTPKPGDPIFEKGQTLVVADNRRAALAAMAQAEKEGFQSLLLSTFVEGEAREVAKVLVALGQEVQDSGHPIPPPACLILGGETTVTLGAHPGQGGRNQEIALAAALRLAGTSGITVVSLATDGTDGPTDSAGGLADGGTVARGAAAGLDAAAHLRNHNAYPFLLATHDLLRTGPTQTNVNDLMFVFVGSEQSGAI